MNYSDRTVGSIIEEQNFHNLINIYNKYSNLRIRLGYFLWIMRGSNMLDQISYYSKSFEELSDGENALRGGYGPRLKRWVGPDQLQEAISINQDIDDDKQYVKPKGIDQMEKVYNDLKNGLSTNMVIFDPSLDFDDTNNVPDLIAMGLKIDDQLKLNVKVFMNNVDFYGMFANDMFFISLLTSIYRSILSLSKSEIIVYSMNQTHNKSFKFIPNSDLPCMGPTNKSPEDLWADLFNLFNLEKHLRNTVTEDSTKSIQINVVKLIQNMINKFVIPIGCEFWREFAFGLIGSVLLKKGGYRYVEFINESILSQMKSKFKTELITLIGDVNGEDD